MPSKKFVLKLIRDYINALINWSYQPFHKYLPIQTYRYAVCGGGNTFLDIVLYFICYNFIISKRFVHLPFITISPHIASFLIVFPFTFFTGFLLSKYITFTDSPLRGRIQLIRYGITVLVSIFLNYILLKLFVEVIGFYPTPSKVIATCVVVIYSYFSQMYFTFKPNHNSKV